MNSLIIEKFMVFISSVKDLDRQGEIQKIFEILNQIEYLLFSNVTIEIFNAFIEQKKEFVSYNIQVDELIKNLSNLIPKPDIVSKKHKNMGEVMLDNELLEVLSNNNFIDELFGFKK